MQLVYFSKEGGARQGEFELLPHSRAFGTDDRQFTVVTDFKKLVFEAEGPGPRDNWVAAIRDAITGGPKGGSTAVFVGGV